MPRPDAARILAENLHQLPHPGGKTHRLLQYAKATHSPQIQGEITERATTISESLIHLLERNGYKIVHKSDPTPEQANPTGIPRVTVHCQHCADPLITLYHLEADPQQAGRYHSALHRVAIESAGLQHPSGTACWE